MKRAQDLLNQSRFDEAVTALRESLQTAAADADRVSILRSLASLEFDTRQLREAAGSLRAVVETVPNDGVSWEQLAKVHTVLGEFERALEIRNWMASATLPANFAAQNHAYRAELLHRLGRRTEARDAVSASLAATDNGLARLWEELLKDQRGGGPRIACALDKPEEYQALAAATQWARPPEWVELGIQKEYTSYLSPTFQDLSFVVVSQEGQALLHAELFCVGSVQGYGGPIRIVPAQGVDPTRQIAEMAIDFIRLLLRAFGGAPVVTDLPGRTASAIGVALMKRKAVIEGAVVMELDLTEPEERLWARLRRRYRSLITAGERKFKAVHLNRENLDWSLLERFRELHYLYWPEPRADAIFLTLPSMRRQIEAGEMEMTFGFDGDRAVSMSAFTDIGGTASYSIGRYVRDVHPDAGPWSMWTGIRRARARGQTRFRLGMTDTPELNNPKMASIAFFKAGFTETIHYMPVWRLRAE